MTEAMSDRMDIQQFVPDLETRFLRYVRIDTQADESSTTVPSTAIQFDLLNLLADESRRRRMGEAGLARARDRFSADRMVSETIAAYERLLASRNHEADSASLPRGG